MIDPIEREKNLRVKLFMTPYRMIMRV